MVSGHWLRPNYLHIFDDCFVDRDILYKKQTFLLRSSGGLLDKYTLYGSLLLHINDLKLVSEKENVHCTVCLVSEIRLWTFDTEIIDSKGISRTQSNTSTYTRCGTILQDRQNTVKLSWSEALQWIIHSSTDSEYFAWFWKINFQKCYDLELETQFCNNRHNFVSIRRNYCT